MTTYDGAAAMMELEQGLGRFNCIITDIRLPGRVDGWSIANRARELTPNLPVVYVTGDSGTQWPLRGMQDSLSLEKPFELRKLVDSVDTLVCSKH